MRIVLADVLDSYCEIQIGEYTETIPTDITLQIVAEVEIETMGLK